MIPCKSSKRCAVRNDDAQEYGGDSALAFSSILCNETEVLCLPTRLRCDGGHDCDGSGDESDEEGCLYVFWKATVIAVIAVTALATSFGCVSTHSAALRKRNLVRFQQDVIKRKDVVKLKKAVE